MDFSETHSPFLGRQGQPPCSKKGLSSGSVPCLDHTGWAEATASPSLCPLSPEENKASDQMIEVQGLQGLFPRTELAKGETEFSGNKLHEVGNPKGGKKAFVVFVIQMGSEPGGSGHSCVPKQKRFCGILSVA